MGMNFIDHHRWLVESNLFTNQMKDNIAMCAFCIVEDVLDASTTLDFENHIVYYKLVLSDTLANNLKLLDRFKNGDNLGFFETMRLKKFIRTKKQNDEGGFGYELEDIANKFIKAYLSDRWSARVEFKSVKDYDGKKDLWLYKQDNSRSD